MNKMLNSIQILRRPSVLCIVSEKETDVGCL